MIKHFLRITVITLLIALCMFFPFFPGEYDGFAVTLSAIAQLLGASGLLLVPVGVIWLLYEIMKNRKNKNAAVTYYFAITTLVISGVVAFVTSLAGLANNKRSVGIIIFAACIYIISRFAMKIKRLKNAANNVFNPAPLYLICIPLALVAIRFMFIGIATEFSRNYAIKKSEDLIRDIEAYRNRTGRYPVSLLSVWEDYDPSIIGIERYYYEPNGEAYNIYFEQFSDQIGVREIVMYNKLDEQEMTSHNRDLLELEPNQIHRGYHLVQDASAPHWKYFWFD